MIAETDGLKKKNSNFRTVKSCNNLWNNFKVHKHNTTNLQTARMAFDLLHGIFAEIARDIKSIIGNVVDTVKRVSWITVITNFSALRHVFYAFVSQSRGGIPWPTRYFDRLERAGRYRLVNKRLLSRLLLVVPPLQLFALSPICLATRATSFSMRFTFRSFE